MRFRKDTKTAIIQRQGYTTTGGYKKSGYTPTGGSAIGHLKALTLQDGVDINSFGRDYEFHTDLNAPIKEADRLVIDNITYDVKGIAEFPGITFSRKMIILNRTQNGS